MKYFTRSLAAFAGLVLPVVAGAQTNYNYNYDYADTYGTADAGVSTGFAAFGIGMMLVFGIIGLLTTIFTIWMIIDAAKRDFDQKVMWILLMVFLGFLPAVIYYFMVKRKNVTGSGHAPTTPSTPSTPGSANTI